MAMNLYIGSVILIAILGGVIFHLLKTRKEIPSFSILDLTNIAMFSSLLYIAILPFKFGLSRIPMIQSFFFAIPYTAVLFIGIRFVPRAGTATFIICGHSLLSQIISSGVNPLWWPYALLASFILELYFIVTRNYLNTVTNALGAGFFRGLTVYSYFYWFSAPYIWHQFYAPWYIVMQTLQGIAGSIIGAFIGIYLSKPIINAARYGGI
jgi:ABC-type thiamin/hydroxymethylpyrimidine transport system permease subunit